VRQEAFAAIYPNEHTAYAQAAHDAATESAGAATEFDHPIVRPEPQIIQEPLGGLGEVNVLNL
jgi:hypothetical protein